MNQQQDPAFAAYEKLHATLSSVNGLDQDLNLAITGVDPVGAQFLREPDYKAQLISLAYIMNTISCKILYHYANNGI